jgi:hypothetical protein
MGVQYTGRPMARRLLAFALAFVVVGGSLAGDVCDAVCAEHAGHSAPSPAPSPHHHSGHAGSQPLSHHHADTTAAPATRSAGLTPPPHRCGVLEAIVSDSREMKRGPMVKAVMTTVRVVPLVQLLPASEMDGRHGPPTSIRSTSPLRI